MTAHVYLSPHLDDVVYSCGGLLARQAAQGEPVLVITLCAGDPPGTLSDFARQLHMRWGLPRAATAARRAEDRAACAALSVEALHGTLPDAVYRLDADGNPSYPDEESIFGAVHPQEAGMIAGLAVWLDAQLPPDAALYAPLGLGGHVDHVIARRLAERLRSPIYYPDYPYAGAGGVLPTGLAQPQGRQLLITHTPREIRAWVAAAALYASQRSTFWATRAAMGAAFRRYHDEAGGLRLIDTRF
ncbi:MAG: PIG-L family deacetylase [Anaerolineales bacterium]|nr:PIG-L family deacetylase [Anaerolineales bacterium]